ncbi:MAG: MFS transporter [Actinocrinis sp.]
MASTEMTNTQTPAPPTLYRRRWAALWVVLAAGMMDLLDSLITTVAGPQIRAHLDGGTTLIQWLAAGYTLAMASGLIVGGRLGDIYGRKRLFLIGMAGFTVSSLLCAVAQNSDMLIAFRVLQGLCGALMLPQGLGIVSTCFPPRELPVAFGLFGPVLSLGTICGPILGGWLVGANLLGAGWRMIFLINLPLGLAGLAAAVRYLPSGGTPVARRLDVLGAVIISAAAALLVYPLVEGRDLGWPWWVFACFAAGAALAGLFGRYEARIQRLGGDPLVELSLFGKRSFTGGLFAVVSLYCGLVGLNLVFTIFVQLGLGFSPLRAALTTLPQAVGSICAMLAARRGLTARLGRPQIHLGLATGAAGVFGLWLTLRQTGGRPDSWQFAPALFVVGVGMGLALAAIFNIVLATVEPAETGSASGVFTAVQQFGGSLGAALLGTAFFGLSGRDGVSGSAERTLWIVMALLAAAFAMALALPRHARTFGPPPPSAKG